MRLIEDAAGVRGREVIPRIIPIATPAAGADWSVNVPGGVLWYVRSISGVLVTSATVANRLPRIDVRDADSNVYFRSNYTTNQAASQTIRYTFTPYVSFVVGIGGASGMLPMLHGPIQGGHIIASSTAAIDVADQWQSVLFYVLEVEERPYDVELLRDVATLRNNTSNAFPEIREGL